MQEPYERFNERLSTDSKISCMFDNIVCNIIINNNMNYLYVIRIMGHLYYKTEHFNIINHFIIIVHIVLDQ